MKIQIKRILCPVDFSEYSDRAFDYATFLTRSHGAKLFLLHVVEHLHGYDHYMILALTPQEIKEKMEEEANDQLKSLMSEVKSRTKVETEVREGNAFVEIVRLAKEKDIDLIVMGSHGRTGLPHLLIGSVAEKVARKARCPVLIVKDKNAKFEMP